MNRHTVETPLGTFTRNSDKRYTHAVVGVGASWHHKKGQPVCLSYASSEVLASKAAKTFANRGHENVAVYPVSSTVEA